MPTPPMTEKEIVDYLVKTSLPTILVEGKDDARIYRWIEDRLGVFSGNVLFCTGRPTLLSIYRQRAKFSHVKIAWLADLDMWKFTSPDPDLNEIVFTLGYSIENDLYAGSRIEEFLDSAEHGLYSRIMSVLCKWFAFELEEYLAGREHRVDVNIAQIIDFDTLDLSKIYVLSRPFREPHPARVVGILGEYSLKMRGKNLIQAISRILNMPGRGARYTTATIIDVCLRTSASNQHIQRIINEVAIKLA